MDKVPLTVDDCKYRERDASGTYWCVNAKSGCCADVCYAGDSTFPDGCPYRDAKVYLGFRGLI